MKKDSQKTIRSRSKRTFAGLPLVDVALGPDPDLDEPHGKAHGIIAIGDEAHGWLAMGGSARGYIALGGSARGILALGGKAMGVVALGGISIGLIAMGRPRCRWNCRRRPLSRRPICRRPRRPQEALKTAHREGAYLECDGLPSRFGFGESIAWPTGAARLH